MATLDLSVIICTHNPRHDYFARVLDGLRKQTLSYSRWELLIVDNACIPAVDASQLHLSWHAGAQVIAEPTPGVAFARQKGIREARGNLIVFVDDDNLLANDYLDQALEISKKWPQLGVWGGASIPEFEVQPSPELNRYIGMLPIVEVKKPRWTNIPTCYGARPLGAGMCVRVEVVHEYVRQFEQGGIQILGRTGAGLLGGEDTEICYCSCALGLGMGLFPQLSLTHLIPSFRVEAAYILKLLEGCRLTNLVLDYKWEDVALPSLFTPLMALRIIKGMLVNRGIHRRAYLSHIKAIAGARRIIHGCERGR